MAIEIEKKIQITEEQLNILKKWLIENAEYKGQAHQIEYYIDNPEKTFYFDRDGMVDSRNYLRIRMTDKGDSLCLKVWHDDPENPGRTTHCDEYESNVEKGKETLELFRALGYTNEVVIDKKRDKYDAKDFEIVIDDVKNLGIFVEVELKKEVNDIKLGYKEINEFLKRIGISKFKEQYRGYVSMLLNPNINFGEEKEI